MAKSASPHPASKWQVKAALVGALAIEFSALVIASRQGMERVRFVAPLSSDPPVGDASLVSSDPPVVAV